MLIDHRVLSGSRLLLLSALIGLGTSPARAAPIDLGTIAIPSTGNPLSTVNAIGDLDQAYFFYFPFTAQGIAAQWNWIAAPGTQPTLATGTFHRSDSLGVLLESLGSFQPSGQSGLNLSYGAITAGYYAFHLTAVSGAFVQYSGQFDVMPTDPLPPPPDTSNERPPMTEPPPVTEPTPMTEPPPLAGLGLLAPTPVTAPGVLPLLGLGTLALAIAMRRPRRAT